MIYLDNASTTKPYKEVLDTYTLVSNEAWGNPSNIYKLSKKPKEYLESAKIIIASTLGCLPEEIFFTSGSSEGNAFACKQNSHTLASYYEHHNYTNNPNVILEGDEEYLDSCIAINKVLGVDYSGFNFAHMLVSNETGEIFDVAPLFNKAHQLGMTTVCDITQAYCNMSINIYELDCDIAIASGHKFHGPRGTGFVFIKKDIQKNISPLIYGTQQSGLRGGTENVAGYYAMAIAAQKASNLMNKKITNSMFCQELVLKELNASGIEYIFMDAEKKIPSTMMVLLKGVESEVLQAMLSDDEIYIGTGSACTTGEFETSKTLEISMVPEDYIHGPVRFSFTEDTKLEEVKLAVQKLVQYYKEIRNE